MLHKLLIEYTIEVEDKFKKILKPDEVIRGEISKIILNVTNLGEAKFPGGTVRELSTDFGLRGLRQTTSKFTRTFECPELEPKETKRLFVYEVNPLDSGVAKISLVLESKDKEPIETYQNPQAVFPSKNVWSDLFYVIDREQILIIQLLQKLLKKKS